MPHLQTREMRNRESALCIRLWSQPLVTSARDGQMSEDKEELSLVAWSGGERYRR
jgi:hypothetical protein